MIAQISFKGCICQQEHALERIKELNVEQEQKRLKEQELLDKISYPELNNPISTKTAGFLSKFTATIQNSSPHDIMEFFGDEKTAEKLREKLPTECQKKDSLLLREQIQKMEELQDPVIALLCANRMKNFLPKEGRFNAEQKQNFLEGLKKIISTIVRKTDLNKFEPADKASILEMVQKVEDSDSLDFGIETKLKMLVDKLNKKNFKRGFIPPVQIRHLKKI